jgi:hypothetical protein
VLFSCFQIANDDHEQIVKVVRDPAAELPNRFQLLRCGELLLNVLELVLGSLPVRNVARDFCKPDDVSGFVRDTIDDDRRPKAGAIFSQTPPFRFKASVLCRLRKRTCWHTKLDVLGSIKSAEMPTDNLRRRVSLNTLRSGIPGCHVAERIELKDRVIDHGLDQLAVAPLTIEKLLVGLLPLGDVSCDLARSVHRLHFGSHRRSPMPRNDRHPCELSSPRR